VIPAGGGGFLFSASGATGVSSGVRKGLIGRGCDVLKCEGMASHSLTPAHGFPGAEEVLDRLGTAVHYLSALYSTMHHLSADLKHHGHPGDYRVLQCQQFQHNYNR